VYYDAKKPADILGVSAFSSPMHLRMSFIKNRCSLYHCVLYQCLFKVQLRATEAKEACFDLNKSKHIIVLAINNPRLEQT